jgi:hypothetical protein
MKLSKKLISNESLGSKKGRSSIGLRALTKGVVFLK